MVKCISYCDNTNVMYNMYNDFYKQISFSAILKDSYQIYFYAKNKR